jgi:uncharacterized protein
MPGNGSPLADTEVHHLRSEHVGDEYKIFVGHCGLRDGAAPVTLYLTDANGLFGGAVDTIRLMHLSAHLPPLLVVGIGYRMGAIHQTLAVRTRDLTPTVDPTYARIFPDQSHMGGARRFLAFIRDELKPWVGARYGVDPDDAAYFGHSMGGLFGTYALLTEPTMFRRHGIGSPSLWWDHDAIFEHEAAYADAHRDLPARAFFAVGAHEDHDGRQREASRLPEDERAKAGLRYIDMVADTDRMVTALRGRSYPSLELDEVVLPGEFHITVPLLNLSRSLRYLFDAPT